MPQHETFYVIRRGLEVTILHEVPDGADELGSFGTPSAAIDFAQQEVRRLASAGEPVSYIDPPEDLVGTG